MSRSSRSVAKTCAPSLTKSSDVTDPSPPVAPVTSTTLPLNLSEDIEDLVELDRSKEADGGVVDGEKELERRKVVEKHERGKRQNT